MSAALEQRFLSFLASVPGSESLDELLGGKGFSGQRRADYLLFERRVIVEVKSLKTDTSPRSNPRLNTIENGRTFHSSMARSNSAKS